MALLVVGVVGCGADEPRRTDAGAAKTEPAGPSATSESSTPASTTTSTTTTPPEPVVDAAIGLGGSTHLARVVASANGESRVEVVEVVDVVTGAVRPVVVAASSRPAALAVSPDGAAVAWIETEGDDPHGRVRIGRTADQPPIVVEAVATCPHWLPDGDLMVSLITEGGVARVDPTTGAVERIPNTFGRPKCMTPIGGDEVVYLVQAAASRSPRAAPSCVPRSTPAAGHSIPVAQIPEGCWAFGLGATPRGDRLAVTVTCPGDPGRSGIWVTMADGELGPLVTEGSSGSPCEYSAPVWSAAGTALTYHRSSWSTRRERRGCGWRRSPRPRRRCRTTPGPPSQPSPPRPPDG